MRRTLGHTDGAEWDVHACCDSRPRARRAGRHDYRNGRVGRGLAGGTGRRRRRHQRVGGLDAGGNFALNNVTPADVVLTFSAPGVSASAPVGVVAMNEVVQVSVTVSATQATIESQQRTTPDNAVNAEGALADLDVAGRQFKIGSTVVHVPTTAVIKRADQTVTLGDLKNGDRVRVYGMKDGAAIRASEVLAQASTTPPPTPPPTPTPEPDVTLNGVLSGLGGTCPALSMSVAGTAVKTNSATVFNARACAELKSGDTVYAIGPKQSDGSVLASKVYYVAPPAPPAGGGGGGGAGGGGPRTRPPTGRRRSRM